MSPRMLPTPLRRALPLLAVLLLVPAVYTDEPAGELPSDLALIPGDAFGFSHLRATDLWKSESMKEIRDLVEKAGPKALEMFDKRFVPAPSSVERLTLIVTAANTPHGPEPEPIVVLRTSKPFDRDKLIAGAMPGAVEKTAGTARFHVEPDGRTALHVVDERTFLFGAVEAVKAMLEAGRKPAGALAPAVRLAAAGKHPFVAAANTGLIPAEALRDAPPPVQGLLKAKLVTMTVTVGRESVVDLGLRYADAKAAEEAEAAAKQGIEMARQMLPMARAELEKRLAGPDTPEAARLTELPEAAAALVGLGMVNQVDEFLKTLPLERKDESLRVTIKPPAGPMSSLVASGPI